MFTISIFYFISFLLISSSNGYKDVVENLYSFFESSYIEEVRGVFSHYPCYAMTWGFHRIHHACIKGDK